MNKLKLSITLLFFISALHTFAQKKIEVKERNTTMSLGARNGYAVTFDGMTKKELKSR
ncbi:MAG: hypothetical protein H7Y00_09595, partial [Fimbriimonadaceae bacterium]|nr:hypothetical protein [Chitinophagales bacterium]